MVSMFTSLDRCSGIYFHSSCDTSNVTDMSGMFYQTGSTSLELNLVNLDTSSVTKMNNMFSRSKAKTINISSFDLSKVTQIPSFIFSNTNLTSVVMPSSTNLIPTSTAWVYFDQMFQNCTSLTSVDLSGINMQGSSLSITSMFEGCSNLEYAKMMGGMGNSGAVIGRSDKTFKKVGA